jgi:hydroxyacylglutathione hydrolase
MAVKKIGNIIMIQLSDVDSNIYLNKDAVVDTGTGFNFTRLMDVLRVFKTDFESFNTIINTHYHFDHIGGNGFFSKAKIHIHADDATPLEKGDPEITVADFFGGNMRPMKIEKKFKEGDKIKFGDLILDVIHTPGHTPGSVCLYEPKNKLLFTGDTIFANGFGRTDLPGGNTDQLKASVQKILKSKLSVDRILPGHGPTIDKDPLKVVEKNFKAFNPEDDDLDFI